MRTIVYGKVGTKRTLSPKIKQIIAILVAVALLLTSCGIIFRNEICEIFEEFFVKLTYSSDEEGKVIEDVYELTYLPDGYYLEKENISPLSVVYKYVDESDNSMWFEQRTLKDTDLVIDSESGYSQIKEYDVYYRFTDKYHYYIWNDGKYALSLRSNQNLPSEEIELIIQGIK